MSFGIALSGGGAKGAAHIGVLAALNENNLIPSSIAGTSMGAIIAGLYAVGYTPREMENIAVNFSKKYQFYLDPGYSSYFIAISQFISKSSLTLSGLIKGNKIENYLKKLTKNINISEAKMPLIIPTVDLVTGKTFVYSNIPAPKSLSADIVWNNNTKLHEIMRASSSLPAIFYPKKISNHILVDGGITHNIPINILKSTGVKNILAIDISQEYEKPKNTNILEITAHSFEIMQRELKKYALGSETFLVSPILPANADMLDFKNMKNFIKTGYDSTIKVIPKLKKLFT